MKNVPEATTRIAMGDYLVQSELTKASLNDGDRMALSAQDLEELQEVLELADKLEERADTLKRKLMYRKAEEYPVPVSGEEALMLLDQEGMDRLHSSLGVLSDSVELVKALKPCQPLDEVDGVNMLEECGDILWFMAVPLRAAQSSFEEAAEKNLNKLKARYPGKFESYSANNRDLDAERQSLEA